MKKKNNLTNDIVDFTKGSVTLGMGTAIVGGAGGNTAGLSSVAGFMPVVGTIVGAKHAVKGLKKIKY